MSETSNDAPGSPATEFEFLRHQCAKPTDRGSAESSKKDAWPSPAKGARSDVASGLWTLRDSRVGSGASIA